MTDEEIKAWMRDNKADSEDAPALAAAYCDEHDALNDDGDVPDEINVLASEVWAEDSDDDSDEDSDGTLDEELGEGTAGVVDDE